MKEERKEKEVQNSWTKKISRILNFCKMSKFFTSKSINSPSFSFLSFPFNSCDIEEIKIHNSPLSLYIYIYIFDQ